MEGLIEQLEARRVERLTKNQTKWTPRQPNASDLTPCLRYQVFRVLAAQLRPPIDAEGLERMENGTLMERHVLRQLEDEGWPLVEQQQDVQHHATIKGQKRLVLSGKIDAKMLVGEGKPTKLLVEVKDTGQFRMEGELDWDNPWLDRWLRQVQSYLLLANLQWGLLVLTHRGARRYVLIELDYEIGEETLKLCEMAVEIIEFLRERPVETLDLALNDMCIPYEKRWERCRGCWARDRVCHPPIPAGEPVEIAERPDLEPLCETVLEKHQASKEYDRARDKLRDLIAGTARVVLCGKRTVVSDWKKRGNGGYWTLEVK